MDDQIQLVEIMENGNVEVCVGADIVHTAANFEAAAAWLARAWGTTVSSHNFGRDVYVSQL